ncbi:hypothetical protein [Flagellimonas sp. S3867]|uniref:hypothetical protein n=1 Tax=Flagellimonas sp. S3867 TaxID=2768063 RepID=UPI0016843169|nr:hypothetical protein [Flagellimonas sp. S3867]
MKKEKTIFEKIAAGIGILLSGFFAFMGLSEYYKIGILKQTEFYPFGGEGPVPYYYRTAELYSYVNLTYGIAFGTLFGLAIWNWKRNKISGIVTLGLTIILILIQIFHGLAE